MARIVLPILVVFLLVVTAGLADEGAEWPLEQRLIRSRHQMLDPCRLGRRIGELPPCSEQEDCDAWEAWRLFFGPPGLEPAEPRDRQLLEHFHLSQADLDRPVQLQATDERLDTVLESLAGEVPIPLVVAPEVAPRRITVDFDGVPWGEALAEILRQETLELRPAGETLRVAPVKLIERPWRGLDPTNCLAPAPR